MTTANDFFEILGLTRELVMRAAHPKRRTIGLSPELASFFNAANDATPSPNAAEEYNDTAAAAPALAAVAPSIEDVSTIGTLAELQRIVSGCRRCALCETRTQTVFSDGSSTAKLAFVGEAPGADEDRQGVPFVGKAGHLLTDIIVKGMKMRREDVYICNVIKCRPPNNRDPLPAEKGQCEPYLIRQLELLKPKMICALGRHAVATLLRTEQSIARLRGKWHFYRGVPVRVTYHPSYLLRNPEDKKLVWDDIQHVMRALNGEEDPFAGMPRPDSEGPSPFSE